MNKKYLVGIFDDEPSLVKAFEEVLASGIKVNEVYTPYPIHEIIHGMGKKTRITHAAFFYGLFGALGVLGFLYFAAAISWPLHFGGKPFNSFPSFMVVTIVATILIVTLSTLFTFSLRAKVFPGKKANSIDIRATDDKFIIVLDKDDLTKDAGTVERLFQLHGASEVYEKEQ